MLTANAFSLSFFIFFLFCISPSALKFLQLPSRRGRGYREKSGRGKRRRRRETQHGAAQQQLHFQYFCRHPNEVDLPLSRDAIYFSLSLSHSLFLSVSLQRQHHFLLLPLPPFVQILVLYIYKFLTTSSLECNYFSIFFCPFLTLGLSLLVCVCVCVC